MGSARSGCARLQSCAMRAAATGFPTSSSTFSGKASSISSKVPVRTRISRPLNPISRATRASSLLVMPTAAMRLFSTDGISKSRPLP